MFDGVENRLASLLFGIPAVKGVEFGDGFAFAGMRGSEANDPYRYTPDGGIETTSNHNGGLLGGITNGHAPAAAGGGSSRPPRSAFRSGRSTSRPAGTNS